MKSKLALMSVAIAALAMSAAPTLAETVVVHRVHVVRPKPKKVIVIKKHKPASRTKIIIRKKDRD